MDQIYEESYTIRAAEVGPNGVVRLDSIAALLQEIAGNHAKLLEFDIEDLRDENITWVLHRLQIQMYRYPVWRDQITISTWPNSGDALRAYRDFRILDGEKKEIGVALSYWLIVNLKTGRPVRIPEKILQMGQNTLGHVLPVSKDKLRWDLDNADKHTFHVRRTDVDLNKHANNVAFIRWVLESVDEKTYLEKICTEFSIQYDNEARLGDQISVYTSKTDEDTFLHRLSSDNTPMAHVKSIWT